MSEMSGRILPALHVFKPAMDGKLGYVGVGFQQFELMSKNSLTSRRVNNQPRSQPESRFAEFCRDAGSETMTVEVDALDVSARKDSSAIFPRVPEKQVVKLGAVNLVRMPNASQLAKLHVDLLLLIPQCPGDTAFDDEPLPFHYGQKIYLFENPGGGIRE